MIKRKILAVLLSVSIGMGLAPSVMAANTGQREMYRLYNPNTGEHFYTANAGEKNSLSMGGWDYEGVGWIAPTSGIPVYRLYNPNAGDHHYTTSVSEKNSLVRAGWRDEGIGWYSGGNVAVYRQYNPHAKSGSHNFTTSKAENDRLVQAGWKAEGRAWNGVGRGHEATVKKGDYYKLYAKYVADLEKKYGRGGVDVMSPGVSGRYDDAGITGVGIVRLLDVNGDGIKELFVGYVGNYRWYGSLCTYYNNKMILYHDEIYISSDVTNHINFFRVNGRGLVWSYIKAKNNLIGNDGYYAIYLKNGKFYNDTSFDISGFKDLKEQYTWTAMGTENHDAVAEIRRTITETNKTRRILGLK